MAYLLTDLDDVPEALRRCAAERLEHAADRLADDGAADPQGAVHDARKDLKKTRSLLRLARPGMPAKAVRRRNDQLREVAASLAAARDADAQVEVADALHRHAAGRLPEGAFEALRAALGEAVAPAGAVDLDAAARRLRELADDTADWPLRKATRATLAEGVGTAYARGADALAAAAREPSSDALHEWRKRVKDLWYHARLLHDAAPRAFKAVDKDAGRLADALGDEHDLALLADRLADPEDPAARIAVDLDALQELVAQRRHELRGEAAALGAVLYAERPKAFTRRVRGYLEAEPLALSLPD